MLRILLSLLCCVSLCSCSLFAPEPVRRVKVPLNLPRIEPIRMRQVKFKVIHKDNATSVLADLEKRKQEPVLFGLTGTDYKNLASNIQALKAYIIAQRRVIELYREYYEGNND